MYAFEHSIFINRPVQEVFDFATNPDNTPKWQSSVESAEWTSNGPVGVGATWRAESKFLGRKIEATTQVTSWDPPNVNAFKTIGGPVPFENRMTFEAMNGGTQMSISGSAELGGFFKLAEGLVGKQVEKQIGSDFAALKLLLESGEV
jgi:uncharacterized membrane protein